MDNCNSIIGPILCYVTIFEYTFVYSVAYRNLDTIGESILAHIGSFVYHIYNCFNFSASILVVCITSLIPTTVE